MESRESVELEFWKRGNEPIVRATTGEKLECSKGMEPSEDKKRRLVEKCRATHLEKRELATDAELNPKSVASE